jgi:hypothetical protein
VYSLWYSESCEGLSFLLFDIFDGSTGLLIDIFDGSTVLFFDIFLVTFCLMATCLFLVAIALLLFIISRDLVVASIWPEIIFSGEDK